MYGGVAEPEARARDRQARIQTSEVGREESKHSGASGEHVFGSVAPGTAGRRAMAPRPVSVIKATKRTHRPTARTLALTS